MKRSNAIILFAVSLLLSRFASSHADCYAENLYLHSTSSDTLDHLAPTGTTAKFKDSPALGQFIYEQIGVWSAAPLTSPMGIESLDGLTTWLGLKNSDDQGAAFDLRVELWRNETAIAFGETTNIKRVSPNPNKAKQVMVSFNDISGSQLSSGDILSIAIFTKVANESPENSSVGLRLYYDAENRPSALAATLVALPTKLMVSSINSGAEPTAGEPFSVTVQSQDVGGVPTNVASETVVSLWLKTGTGMLGGTLSGVIAAGTNQLTISGLTYTKAESGVVVTAMRTGGDDVAAGDSAPFAVKPGMAAQLAFSTQPGNSAAGSPIAGPPTVVVHDYYGNLTASTALITVALGNNPGSAVLDGTTTKNAVAGVASFSDLSINQGGTGYSLSAAATGLTGATSGSFNVIASAGVNLTAQPAAVAAGNPFSVTWAQIPNSTARDWIGLYTPGSNDLSYIDYRYVGCGLSPTVPVTSGNCSFPIPTSTAPGTYEFRLLPNDSYNSIATSNPVIVGPPSSINMLTVTTGSTVTAGMPGFTLTVRSQTPSGIPANLASDTDVSISLSAGSGVLGGTLAGTILAGTNQVTIGPANYTKAESGVIVIASRTNGDALTAGTSLPFTVSPGPAAKLVFTAQPGNATAGSAIPGPPTVTVEDSVGNPVNAPTTAITIAIGSNPSMGTLSGNLTVTTGASVSFPSLSIDQAGDGYTLTASADGLASATSNPFNITSGVGAGGIVGVITRVNGGAAIEGAVVEAFQGTTLRGTAVSDGSGNYTIDGLAAGSYTVRASFSGLVPQVASNVEVVDGNITNVSLSLNLGIAVQTPIAGATISDFSVLVHGHFDKTLAPEVGITVNGFVALIDGDEFAAFVPIDSQTNTLTALLKDPAGNLLAGDAVPITPEPPTNEPVLSFRPFPAIALVAQPVSFSLTSINEITQVQLDGNGDGTTDFTGTTLEGISVTFAEPGLYLPTVTVIDPSSASFTDSAVVQVLDITQMDARLRAKWDGMKNALRAGDTSAAADYIVSSKRANYQELFNNLTIPFSSIDQMLGNITYQAVKGLEISYDMLMNDGPDGDVSYLVLFSLDIDGIWRISFL